MDGCKLERRQDGPYIIYTPVGGADPVVVPLGKPNRIVLATNLDGFQERTIDCTSIKGYNKKTADDFLIEITGISRSGPNIYGAQTISKTYDPASGQLTISNCCSWTEDYKGHTVVWAAAYNVICFA